MTTTNGEINRLFFGENITFTANETTDVSVTVPAVKDENVVIQALLLNSVGTGIKLAYPKTINRTTGEVTFTSFANDTSEYIIATYRK